MQKIILAAALLSVIVIPMFGQTIEALPVSGKITLDGKLTEGVWAKAKANSSFLL